MDRRTLLKQGACLNFPGMQCTIESLEGKGSNAVVYQGSYPDGQQPGLRHRVLVRELFPYHPGGAVYRDGEDNICFDEDGEETMRLHRRSFGRGNEVHIRLQGSHPENFDFNINTFSLHHTLYSVLGFSGGRTLDKELELQGTDRTPLTVHIRRMMGALNVLEAFHESGYLHLDISPDNILLIGEGRKERVSLIDYNSVHTLEEIRNGNSLYYSEKEGYTAPEIRGGRIPCIGPATDLYSLTAVFYRCITGRNLTAAQMVSQSAPDLSDAECVKGMPETILSMLHYIMRHGLASSGRRRYQNVPAMRRDLEELQDRIDGKGITHWALWEAGRAGILHTVKANPALEYIREEENVYPIAGTKEDGKTVTLTEMFEALRQSGGGPEMVLGSAGMGKTTALLRMAYLQKPRYSGAEPAIIYISLYGWHDSDGDYIKNKILENLRFKPETDSMETAKHELRRLLSSPSRTSWGERPRLLLLLDGLNEASGDLSLLVKEIMELSGLPGLKMLLTSRSPVTGLDFPKVKLRQLEESEVKAILAGSGILPPENQALLRLLRTPMMLSIFMKTALDGEKQPLMDPQEQDPKKQLLSRYLSAMLEKEEKDTPEDSPGKWAAEAAIYYLLPEMAEYFNKRGTALSDQEILPLVEKCWRRLSKRDMTAVFPQWIGHLSDIRGGAENAEEWYGRMVHGILWRRLGLLICGEDGKYRIVHQLIEEYLAETCRQFEKRFARRQRVRGVIAAFMCILLAGVSWKWVYLPYQASHVQEDAREPYDEALADTVLSTALQTYANLARQYEGVTKILECLQEEEPDENEYERSILEFDSAISTTSADHSERARSYADSLPDTGEVMPWSKKPLDADGFADFVSLPAARADEYQKYVEILKQLKEDQELWEEFGESYVDDFAKAVESDAYVNGKYYNILIKPELDAMESSDSEEDRDRFRQYASAGADYPKQNEITQNSEDTIVQYERNAKVALRNFRENWSNGLIKKKQEK